MRLKDMGEKEHMSGEGKGNHWANLYCFMVCMTVIFPFTTKSDKISPIVPEVETN